MPDVKCPRCVNLAAVCDHKELAKCYRFRIKCDGCEHFDEKIRELDEEGKCQCPFCGQIEQLDKKRK